MAELAGALPSATARPWLARTYRVLLRRLRHLLHLRPLHPQGLKPRPPLVDSCVASFPHVPQQGHHQLCGAGSHRGVSVPSAGRGPPSTPNPTRVPLGEPQPGCSHQPNTLVPMRGERRCGGSIPVPHTPTYPPLAHELHAGLVQLDGLGERAGSRPDLRQQRRQVLHQGQQLLAHVVTLGTEQGCVRAGRLAAKVPLGWLHPLLAELDVGRKGTEGCGITHTPPAPPTGKVALWGHHMGHVVPA